MNHDLTDDEKFIMELWTYPDRPLEYILTAVYGLMMKDYLYSEHAVGLDGKTIWKLALTPKGMDFFRQR